MIVRTETFKCMLSIGKNVTDYTNKCSILLNVELQLINQRGSNRKYHCLHILASISLVATSLVQLLVGTVG